MTSSNAVLKFLGVITTLVLGACSLAQAADASAEVPADRIIYATAIVTGSKLVTRDRFLRSYDPVRTIW